MSEEMEGFSLRRAIRKLSSKASNAHIGGFKPSRTLRWAMNKGDNVAGFHPVSMASRYAHRFGLNYGGEDVDNYEGDENFEGFGLFKRKAGGTKFGNLLRKGAQIGAGIASNIPGVGTVIGALPIGQGLMMKPAEIKADPATAVAAAQTPEQARVVVQNLAPSLEGRAQNAAINDVMRANSDSDALRTVGNLSQFNKAASDSKQSKTLIWVGSAVGGFIVLGVIIWLIVRK